MNVEFIPINIIIFKAPPVQIWVSYSTGLTYFPLPATVLSSSLSTWSGKGPAIFISGKGEGTPWWHAYKRNTCKTDLRNLLKKSGHDEGTISNYTYLCLIYLFFPANILTNILDINISNSISLTKPSPAKAHSRMGHYFFSYLLTWVVDFIEILEIMSQMWQYVIFLSLKPTKVTSDFILN